MAVSKKEAERAIADRDYWRSVGEPLGLRLHGFTYRDAATFYDDKHVREPVYVYGWLVPRLLQLIKK